MLGLQGQACSTDIEIPSMFHTQEIQHLQEQPKRKEPPGKGFILLSQVSLRLVKENRQDPGNSVYYVKSVYIRICLSKQEY
jgi:hypothetical protein